MLRIIVLGLALIALVVGIVIVGTHDSDCTMDDTTTVIVGGHPYQIPSCR